MRFALLLHIILFYTSLSSQEASLISLFDKLYHQDSIRLTLTYPFDSLNKSNHDQIDALISIETDSGFLMTNEPLTLNLRGKFRRMKCTFPPLLLNFKKSTLKNLDLASMDEIKLVTHCIDGPEGQVNLEEERMLYQVYESLTPISYRTIWLTVNYCDMSRPGVCDTSAGFLLEPDKVISSRLGISEKKIYNVSEDSLQFDSYGLTTAFNFLIGNRDWSVIASRNAKLFYDPTLGKYVVIPYDFDYSNIVDASYRRKTFSESMTHPFDRIYEGEYFKDKAGTMLKSFYEFQHSIIETVNSAHNPMDAQRRKKICRYFTLWFNMVDRYKPDALSYGTVCPYKGGL